MTTTPTVPGLRRRRLSRPCYDKPHRCPGWAGGGTRSAKVDRCENGSIRTRVPYPGHPGEFEYPGSAVWHFGHCSTCGVITWPYALRWLDLRYLLTWKAASLVRRLRWWMEDRRRG